MKELLEYSKLPHEKIALLDSETIQKIQVQLAEIAKRITELFNGICESLDESVKHIVEALTPLINTYYFVFSQCPNKRVAHLARYGKKHRTRNKNINRALRLTERRF